MADRKRTDLHFQVGDQVLLKLQPYTQSSVANGPFPKLSNKYYGPYTILEKIGKVAYKLQLLEETQIHPIFHISQLKPFIADFSPVFSELPVTIDIEAASAVPEQVLQHRLVKKGNTTTPQVLIKWSKLPATSATWEDYNVLCQCYPTTSAWGQASSLAGLDVTPDG